MPKETDIKKNEGGQPGNTNAEKWTEEKATEVGDALLAWYTESETNLFFKDFLLENGYYKDLIEYLSNKFESFSDVIKKAQEWQELRLVKWGVLGKLNQTMTIFVLKNHHGYRDEHGLRLTKGTGLENLTDEQLTGEILQLTTDLGLNGSDATNGETQDVEAVVVSSKTKPVRKRRNKNKK